MFSLFHPSGQVPSASHNVSSSPVRHGTYPVQNPVDKAIEAIESAKQADSDYLDLSELLSVHRYSKFSRELKINNFLVCS